MWVCVHTSSLYVCMCMGIEVCMDIPLEEE